MGWAFMAIIGLVMLSQEFLPLQPSSHAQTFQSILPGPEVGALPEF
jgi:hypothetical protein